MKIKRMLIALAITIPVLGLTACGTANKKEACEWSKVNEVAIAHKSYYGGFEDKNHGITVGYSGEVHYSTDSGKTWPSAYNASACRFGLDIVDENIAWNCGNNGHVRFSTDGGKTWNKASDYGNSEPNQCRHASFLDDTTGWLAAPDMLGKTSDGGKTWTDIKLPDGIGKILTMNLLDKDTGYLVDSNSKLYTTTDGGDTWTSKKIPTKDMENVPVKSNTQKIKFLDKNNAEYFYFDNDQGLHYLVTKDGGKTWTEKTLGKYKNIGYGGLYLSHDGKLLTINDALATNLIVLEKK